MGPAATCDLMQKIIDSTAASCDQEHIPMIIDSNTRIPDRTAAILSGGPSPVPELIGSAKRLEAAGADFLIIPCNTAHYFIDEVRAVVDIPVLNMPEETAGLLRQRGITKAAVLATDGTVRSGLYKEALEREGIAVLYPDEEEQGLVMSLIYDYIKRGITDPDELPCDEIGIDEEAWRGGRSAGLY